MGTNVAKILIKWAKANRDYDMLEYVLHCNPSYKSMLAYYNAIKN